MTDTKVPEGSTLGKGCLIIILIFFGVGFYYYVTSDGGSDTPNACLASEQFIKRDLNYPGEADLPFLDCHVTEQSGNNYTVLRKITAKNAFGMETDYIYKVKMEFMGGDPLDDINWRLKDIKSEKSY